MTKDEWLAIVQEMRARWPHAEIPKATLAVWFMDVQDLAFERVRETLRELGRSGREFPPTGGVLRARSLEALDVEGGLTEIEAAEVERRVAEIMASYKRNISEATVLGRRFLDAEGVRRAMAWEEPRQRERVKSMLMRRRRVTR